MVDKFMACDKFECRRRKKKNREKDRLKSSYGQFD